MKEWCGVVVEKKKEKEEEEDAPIYSLVAPP